MIKVPAKLLLAILVAASAIRAQAPTGTIAGVVTDPAGASVPGARLSITNPDSGLTRRLTTSGEGDYSAAALPPGVYKVTAEAAGFMVLERTALVEAGTTTTVNLTLQTGGVNEEMKVSDAAPLIHYEHHQVSGVISRAQIESLPLNGRNFLDLAKLEPGVSNPVRGTNNRVFVPILGAGLASSPRIGYTRVTVDGGDTGFTGTVGAALQVSQEVVQEFQMSTVNFDLSTSVTTDGAINIVTRSGGNQYHGSGFYFYRDHNLSAYPGLQRDVTNPDPFFQRKQYGYSVGGPIRKDRASFFSSYERNDQRGVFSVQPRTPEFASLGGIFPSPFVGNQLTLRGDVRFNSNNNGFARVTHDGNSLFGPVGNNLLPSGWSRIKNRADQSLFALTSVLSSSLVSDLRFSYFSIQTSETPAGAADCAGCFGVGAPRISIPDVGVTFGTARKLSGPGQRYELTESLMWQKRNHRLRFGFDWEHTTLSAELIDQEPASIQLYSPERVRSFNALPTIPPALRIPLPRSFTTLDDILQLPLKSFQTAVGPGLVLERGFRESRVMDLYRLYAGDTWRTGARLIVNYGLAWSYEPNSLNTDLTKPTMLTAILGSKGLNAPSAQTANFSPSVGLAWAATRDGKTVVRAGAGRYLDLVSFNSANISSERFALSPAGTGRMTVPGSGILDSQGRPLNFINTPTRFTAANLLTILPGIRAGLARSLNPDNREYTLRNIDVNKTGQNLSDPFYETPYALHFNLGAQRELAHDLVLSADFVWRRFLHTFIPDIDYNRFNRRPQGPVIPACSASQRSDVRAVCSAGPITFDNTSGIAQYRGLLVRLEKRFSRRTQFLASYALGSFKGSNATAGLGGVQATGFNNDNWFENYGPLPGDLRHILNFSGFVDLPWRFQIACSVSAYSRPPLSVFVNGLDFNGDGTTNDLLPGTRVNQFNRGLDEHDLPRLVEKYNQQVSGAAALHVTLPSNYSLGDGFFTQDLRVSRTFALGTERLRLVVLGEAFNLLNIANLIGYDGNIANTSSFGQPGARFSQVFGSGGPRAFQFGARLSF